MNRSTEQTTVNSAQDWLVEFPVLERIVFLNHAALSPLPARAARALLTYTEEAAQLGGAAWPRWNGRIKQARPRAAQFLGAGTDEVAFVQSTTHGLIVLAQSLPWRAGDNVISGEHEFPANIYPWQNLAERGVALRLVPERPDYRYSVDDYIARIDARTRLVAVSLVQYSTGYRMPVEQLAEVCRKRGIWICVDGIQGTGALPFNVKESGCDFFAAGGQKWMLGPEGIGLLYVDQERLGLFNDAMTGFAAREQPWDHDNITQKVVHAARRFETGGTNMAGIQALDGSLNLLMEVGAREVWRRIEEINAQLVEGLKKQKFEIISPRGEGERSGIVAFTKKGLDPEACMKKLGEEEIYLSARRGWLRVAPHFYTQPEQIERLLGALQRIGNS